MIPSNASWAAAACAGSAVEDHGRVHVPVAGMPEDPM